MTNPTTKNGGEPQDVTIFPLCPGCKQELRDFMEFEATTYDHPAAVFILVILFHRPCRTLLTTSMVPRLPGEAEKPKILKPH